METIKDYLEKLEIENNILNKQLADVDVTKVIYFKEEKIIYIYLSSKNIIS
ncbi:PolC-type DNA polymerase III N-terminal domain-containing protein, partial [Paraclostridium bifermentans]